MFQEKTETRRWLKALEIARVLFEEEGYHTRYIEDIATFIRRKRMYSPKIKEEYIPILYRLARFEGIPMTKLVNGIIKDYFTRVEQAARQLVAQEITKDILRKMKERRAKNEL